MKSLIQKTLLNITRYIVIHNFKRLSGLKNYIWLCINIRIRNVGKFKTPEHNKKDDETIIKIEEILTKKDINHELSESEKNILSKCKKDLICIELCAIYEETKNINTEKRKELNSEAFKITKVILSKKERKKLKELKKRAKVILKENINDVFDRTRLKYDLSISDLTSSLSVITATIFIGGYLHTRILFNYYDIDVSLFFQLTDYINIGIQKIEYALIVSAVLIIYLL